MLTKLASTAVLMGVLTISGSAMAQGNSTPGVDRYNEIRQNPNPSAQCDSGAGSGAFGFLGKGNNLGIKSDPNDPGADGRQTGLNNSAVCGNRQNS